MPLGHDPSIYLQGALEAQRESRRNTANILEQLGKQVREDIQRVQTTRDLRAFGEELSQINPQSREFPLQALGAAMRHPLAFEDKRGQAAINLLGGAHRNWQMQQTAQMRASQPRQFAPIKLKNGAVIQVNADGTSREISPPLPEKPILKDTDRGLTSLIPDPNAPGGFDTTVLVPDDPKRTYRSGPRGGLDELTVGPDGTTVVTPLRAPEQDNTQKFNALMRRETNLQRELDKAVKEAELLDEDARSLESSPSLQGSMLWETDKAKRRKSEAAAEAAAKREQAKAASDKAGKIAKELEQVTSDLNDIQNTLAPSGDAPTVTSKAEFDALPSGAIYIGNDGRRRKKP